MATRTDRIELRCIAGKAGSRDVLMGSAPASVLHRLSFADVLDENSGRGYQRRFNTRHSLDFRRYVQRDGATTIPLTLNLRPEAAGTWRVEPGKGGLATIVIDRSAKVMAQVDCQHRLGHLSDVDVELPFMTFVGLDAEDEREIFRVINGKAKGLSGSLLDLHDAALSTDLRGERPELVVALYLKNEPSSPWHGQLDTGGSRVSGLTRRASLRTLQKACRRFLSRSGLGDAASVDQAARIALDFWSAVTTVLDAEWRSPRRHVVTKGIGVYALMELAAEITLEAPPGRTVDRGFFVEKLSDFAGDLDWTNDGSFAGMGGEGAVKTALGVLREARRRSGLRLVHANG